LSKEINTLVFVVLFEKENSLDKLLLKEQGEKCAISVSKNG
jgi:hypothetical protein